MNCVQCGEALPASAKFCKKCGCKVAAAVPAASSAALLIQTQLVEWTLTGAAIQWPSYFENFCSAVGTTSRRSSGRAAPLPRPRKERGDERARR